MNRTPPKRTTWFLERPLFGIRFLAPFSLPTQRKDSKRVSENGHIYQDTVSSLLPAEKPEWQAKVAWQWSSYLAEICAPPKKFFLRNLHETGILLFQSDLK
jgi:hypothetical protein